MKRQHITLLEIANYENLLLAVHKAAKAKKHRNNVQSFLVSLDDNLRALSKDILAGKLPYGRFKAFEIHDPKRRWIHAACFEDRVFHHAVMNVAGQTLERAMFYHSYACRPQKGVHKAIQQVQRNLQRHAYLVKIDISAYFTRIDHDCLMQLLETKYKGDEFLSQLWRIIKSCPERSTLGLPIGSLTSQYFANFYLDGLDRFLAMHPQVSANLRYMDDVLWWCETKAEAQQLLLEVKLYLHEERYLTVKPSVQILPSKQGVSFCVFRVHQGVIRLSRRRKHAFKQRKHFWEQQYMAGEIDDLDLQMAYAAVHSVTQGTDSLHWRQKQLRRHRDIEV